MEIQGKKGECLIAVVYIVYHGHILVYAFPIFLLNHHTYQLYIDINLITSMAIDEIYCRVVSNLCSDTGGYSLVACRLFYGFEAAQCGAL